MEMFRQTVDLLDVEDGVGFEKGDIAFGLFARLRIRFAARDLRSKDNLTAPLAFANRASKLKRLFEGHPDGRGIAPLHRRTPKHEDIDALIGNAVAAQRTGYPSSSMLCIPRLVPRPDTLLQTGHDLRRNALIDICLHCLLPQSKKGLRMQPC
jgi:hypothetical protein